LGPIPNPQSPNKNEKVYKNNMTISYYLNYELLIILVVLNKLK